MLSTLLYNLTHIMRTHINIHKQKISPYVCTYRDMHMSTHKYSLLKTHTHTHAHTHTHTHTYMHDVLLHFSLSLPVGLLVGQLGGGWVANDYGVTCAYGIMYIFEHWRPKMRKYVQQNATEQFKQATLSLLVAYT